MKTILQQARKKKGLRSRELAHLLGVDQSLISKFENGKRLPSVYQIYALADLLDLSSDYLLKEYFKQRIITDLADFPFAGEVLNMVQDEMASYIPRRYFEDKAIEPLLHEIDVLKAKLDAIREFENHRITEALEIEYTFESNRIEGNTLTLRETEMVINQGLTVSGKTMKEHLEAINHHDAIGYVRELVAQYTTIHERELLALHNLVLRGIFPQDAGKYRTVQVMIQGSAHMPPAPFLVRKQMEDYFIWYENNKKLLHPVVLAAEMHERLVTIHPFIDGNGRTSRLIMNAILLQHGFIIANIKGDNATRLSYYEALESVQTSGSKDAFIRFIAEVEKQSLERYLSILQ